MGLHQSWTDQPLLAKVMLIVTTLALVGGIAIIVQRLFGLAEFLHYFSNALPGVISY